MKTKGKVKKKVELPSTADLQGRNADASLSMTARTHRQKSTEQSENVYENKGQSQKESRAAQYR
jgi:hypothetical protein